LLRVLVASDHPVVRAGLGSIVVSAADLTLAGETGSGDLLDRVAALQPDVVLLDAGASGLNLVWQLADGAAEVPVVLLAREGDDDALRQALQAGARGYLPWDATAEEILAALRAAAAGLVVVSPALAQPLIDAERPARSAGDAVAPAELPEPLTPRELEVLRLLAEGLPSKTIAARLGLSEHTVKFHVGSLLAKLGAASRTEAVTLAIRRGLLTL
jgi:NarL family two-component system response regulator YdfI